MDQAIEDFVRGLEVDAHLVGGAVRDELLGRASKDADFLVPGVDYDGLRALLARHGRVEELEVAGRRVGARLHPRDPTLRAAAPAGIEFAPPRVERSTGPGRHDFEIVADPSLSVEDDMRRRDFTVNAIARSLATGEYLDPLRGREDLERGVLRAVSPRSFQEDPLRLVRGLRLVSQLDLDPDAQTLEQMRRDAPAIAHVSGERIGGGLGADAQGELSKLLLGAHPAKALRLARDTGVLTALLPEFAPALAYDQESRWHTLPLDEHLFATVQAAAGAGYSLEVRLAALLHDLGKPAAAWRGRDGRVHYYAKPGHADRGHEEIGAELAARILRRLRYPNAVRRRVRELVANHMVDVGRGDAARARRFLARHGDELAVDLLDHREADFRGKHPPGAPLPEPDLARLAAFRAVVEQERSSPHRLSDLAVDGADLIDAGFTPGPELGRALQHLLDQVVGDPALNTRERLLERARRLLAARR